MPKDETSANSLSLAGFKDNLAEQADAAAAEVATDTSVVDAADAADTAVPEAADPVRQLTRKLDRARDYAQIWPPAGSAHFMQDDGFYDFHGNEVPDPNGPSVPDAALASADPLPSVDELQNVHTNKIRALVLKAGGEWTGDRAAAIAFLTTKRS